VIYSILIPTLQRPRSVHVVFVVDKVALGQAFLRVLRFSPLSVVPPWLSVLIYLGMNIKPFCGRSSYTISAIPNE
jgi:hypothetical protein